MNERIKELYRQAHTTRYYDGDPMREGNPPTVYWQGEVSAQRFAELIVRECSRIITEGGYWNHALKGRTQASPPEIAKMIKDYFGVNE